MSVIIVSGVFLREVLIPLRRISELVFELKLVLYELEGGAMSHLLPRTTGLKRKGFTEVVFIMGLL